MAFIELYIGQLSARLPPRVVTDDERFFMIPGQTYLYQTFGTSLSWFVRENKFILVRNELAHLNLMSKEEMELCNDLFYEEIEFDTLRQLLDYAYKTWPYSRDLK